MKVFTFSPRNFRADPTFFWRDSGILYEAAQNLGHQAKVVLRAPAFSDDPACVIRGTKTELTNPLWWKGLGCDVLIMVAWALPEDIDIVRAIKMSGIKLALHLDFSGNCFPLNNWIPTLKLIWSAEKGLHPFLPCRMIFYPARVIKWAIRFAKEFTRAKYDQLLNAQIVSLTTPDALKGLEYFCKIAAPNNPQPNFLLTGLPISNECRWNPEISKENRIVSIGRWDALIQKRPFVLIDVSEKILLEIPNLHVDVFGRFPEFLRKRVSKMNHAARSRFHVHGIQPGPVISAALQRAKIYLCTSSFESGPQTAYEAAACGSSFVSLDTPGIAAGRYLHAVGHADLATRDTTNELANAVRSALNKWESGHYNPCQMSQFWAEKCHATMVLKKLLIALQQK